MMKIQIVLLFLVISVFSAYSEDTLVGWTIPDNSTLPLSNIGNANNLGAMYLEAAKINEISFGTINLTRTGFTSKCGSVSGWDTSINKKSWKISVDATGYGAMKLYARVSSDSNFPGPRDFKIQYQNGCCDPVWRDIPDAVFHAGKDWNTGFINGQQIPEACNGMSGLHLRFLITSDTSTAGVLLKHDGISMIDDIYVTGTKLSGIDENRDQFIHIYPNPSFGTLHINAENPLLEVSIIDIAGKSIYYNSDLRKSLEIDLSGQVKGIYFVNIKSKDDFYCRKIILQ